MRGWLYEYNGRTAVYALHAILKTRDSGNMGTIIYRDGSQNGSIDYGE